ncbi:MAG: response regulator [Cyclobacteriaceae bacterium]
MNIKTLLLLFSLFLSVSGLAQGAIEYQGAELDLRGQWDFYWKELFVPGESVPKTAPIAVKLPSYWNQHEELDEPLPHTGYATYVKKIVADQDYVIGVKYLASHSAQRIYLNGELLIEDGQVSANPEDHKSKWLPNIVQTRLKKGQNILTIQVSNYEHARAGIYAIPTIGPWEAMKLSRERQVMLESFIIGCLFIIAIFFIGLYVMWRQAKAFVLYGLFALSFSFWYGNYGLHLLKMLVEIEWSLVLRLSYMSLYLSFIMMMLFMYNSFKGLFHKWVIQLALTISAIVNVFVLFAPVHVFTDQIMYAHIIGLAIILYSTFISIVGVFKKLKGSVLTAISMSSYTLAMFVLYFTYNDIFLYRNQVMGLLFLNSFIVFGVMLAQRIELSYQSVIELQKKTEEQKEQIEKQAMKLKRLDQFKSRFFANVSHDFRSPLTLIKGYLDILKAQDNQLTEKSNMFLKQVELSVDQLVNLTTEIGKLIRLEEGKITLSYQAVNIYEQLANDVEMFRTMAEQSGISISFKNEIPEDTIIHADAFNLQKIIYNLINNAVKYTPKEGDIEIKLSQSGGNAILFCVSDTGEGISEEDLPYIFDRFYQSVQNHHRITEGMGIGLALVKELVDLHGGEITIESKLHEGSKFKVVLPYNLDKPLSQRAGAENVKSSPESQKAANSKKESLKKAKTDTKAERTLLVVDDHPDIRTYICNIVDEKYSILEASDGLEALKVLKNVSVDLIITDLMMPNMDGTELVHKLRSQDSTKTVPIIAISARTSEEVKQEVLDAGANLFMSKPFDSDKFNESIGKVLSVEA